MVLFCVIIWSYYEFFWISSNLIFLGFFLSFWWFYKDRLQYFFQPACYSANELGYDSKQSVLCFEVVFYFTINSLIPRKCCYRNLWIKCRMSFFFNLHSPVFLTYFFTFLLLNIRKRLYVISGLLVCPTLTLMRITAQMGKKYFLEHSFCCDELKCHLSKPNR